jgi:hypothetical protein
MAAALGVFLIACWGVLWLLEQRWRALPAYHRPRITHGSLYRAGAGPLRKGLLAAGILAFGAADWRAAAAALVLLAGVAVARRVAMSDRSRRRRMQREFDRLRAANPAAPAEDLLCQVVLALHPRWGVDLVKQIVTENPGVEASARMVGRMERELG